ncbi:XRE family transcriptional regulator [Xanthocytophaga agilis]|uniref:XRE family transcriptional regulator n=1 Tax=Xanthocytophaga agilis TaxID=3048010 RepID=A0AAE3R5M6_9BACT|nr:XRE family transcriptional regulator [Xanthocytophaga agilis]MDJ1502047.1 XRE family transcriptional regulator [Xanthocytophaga agilis]
MTPSEQNIFGNRLKLARKMAGFSLQELADALENIVTKQALHKYEMGLMKPSNDALIAISKALKVKPDFFLKTDQVELGEVLFRKKTTLSKKIEESIIEKVRYYVERSLEIENILGLESKFENPLENFVINNRNDIELAAAELRSNWQLGLIPIHNLVEMLELRGVKILLIDDVDDIDGLAVYTSEKIPIVVVNTRNKPIERIRFTVIHELAHLLLILNKSIEDNPKEVEKYCHLFSSCFLLPREMLIKMIGSTKRNYIKIQELIAIKEYFGISIRAIVHRLKEMEVITESYYNRWVVYISKEYGAKDEPGKYKGEEKSRNFDQLVNRALAEELISLSKAATLWDVTVDQLRNGYIGKQ